MRCFNPMKMGQKLRRKRCDLGISQEEVGLRAGVDGSQISRLERGCANVRLSKFAAVVTTLELSADYLLWEE